MTATVPAVPEPPATPGVQRRIAEELGVREGQVSAAVELLDGGATVPFIARYRKEVTGALDDAQLRTLEERLRYLRELEERRAAILESVRAQGKLDDELAARIMAADSKARLEDIYLPYKPKRRTKAQIAREAGLEPLADQLLAHPQTVPEQAAADVRGRGARRARRGRRAGRRPGHPGRAVRRGRRPDRRATRADVVARPAGLPGPRGPGGGGRQVRRLLRVRRAVHRAALAPDPGHDARGEGRDPRPDHGSG